MKKVKFTLRDPSKCINIGIAGLNAAGASLALALRAANPYINVVGTDKDDNVLEYAFTGGIIQLGNANPKILRGTSAVFVFAAAEETPERIREVFGVVGHDAIISDAAPVKEFVLRALPAGIRYVGGAFFHPVAAGILQARADLWKGARYVLTADGAKPCDVAEIRGLIESAGAVIEETTARAHDTAVAETKQLPALAAHALAAAGVTNGVIGAERVSAGELLQNKPRAVSALDRLTEGLSEIKRLIEADDAAGLADYLRASEAPADTFLRLSNPSDVARAAKLLRKKKIGVL
jgi:prephenate dehydrogenase